MDGVSGHHPTLQSSGCSCCFFIPPDFFGKAEFSSDSQFLFNAWRAPGKAVEVLLERTRHPPTFAKCVWPKNLLQESLNGSCQPFFRSAQLRPRARPGHGSACFAPHIFSVEILLPLSSLRLCVHWGTLSLTLSPLRIFLSSSSCWFHPPQATLTLLSCTRDVFPLSQPKCPSSAPMSARNGSSLDLKFLFP